MRGTNILFTGPPGCGKSTLIERIVSRIDRPATGFFTREIREQGRRMGFSITTLDGQRGLLAHRSISCAHRVGAYGVNLEDLERIAVRAMTPTRPGEVVVVDEVGKMECVSALFREALVRVLESSHPVIGSVSLRAEGFIRTIKERGDVVVVQVTRQNRDRLAETDPFGVMP